jgi:DNA-binding response OmpR family regulator
VGAASKLRIVKRWEPIMLKILIVEDEKPISNLIKISLTNAGYQCECVYDGLAAADKIEQVSYDLILLDIMLPKINGYELLEYIRPLDIPVIFITAKAAVTDRVKGLKLGADDYLTKPFEIIELLARVETVLRRYHKTELKISIEDLEIDTQSRVVKKNGEIITLTKKEFELLLLFIQNKNIALFREKIYERVWECEYMGDSRTVDLHVQRMRKKVGWEDKITAVYKIGYRLEV